MSQEAVERLLGRMITDDRFRKQAQGLLGSACRQEGYLLSPEEIRMVSGIDLTRFRELADQISPGLRRASCCGEP